MPTLTESVETAVAELRQTRIANQDLATLVEARLAQKTTDAQVVINNFLSRAPYNNYYIDPALGVDDTVAGRGLSLAKPFKTLEYAFQKADLSVVVTFHILGDVVLERPKFLFQTVTLIGIVRDASQPRGWNFLRRKLQFLAEGIGSPYDGVNRSIANITPTTGVLRFQWMELALSAPAPGIGNSIAIFSTGALIVCEQCYVSIDRATNDIWLIASLGQQTLVTFAGSTFGPNVPGRLFNGIAAGGDPNSVWAYRSNITSA